MITAAVTRLEAGAHFPALTRGHLLLRGAFNARVCQKRSDTPRCRALERPEYASGVHTENAAGQHLVDLCETHNLVVLLAARKRRHAQRAQGMLEMILRGPLVRH
jgi:hypothetical protein